MRLRRWVPLTVVTVLASLLAATSLAPAAKPPKSASFKGTLIGRFSSIKVTFKVSSSGKRVRSLKIDNVPIYCEGGGQPIPVSFPSAAISGTGGFTSRATTRFDDGSVQTKLKITGKFVKRRSATGTLTVDWQFKDDPTGCDGKSKFSAKA